MKNLKLKNPYSLVRDLEVLIGLFALIKGLWLFHDQQYFFYPPRLVWLMDNKEIDILVAVCGLMLIIFAFLAYKTHRKAYIIISKVFLVACGVTALILFLLQVTHGIFTPEYRMSHTALGDGIIFALVYLTVSYS